MTRRRRRPGSSGEATHASRSASGWSATRSVGPSTLVPWSQTSVCGRIVVKHADHVPRRRHAVRGADQLECLARKTAPSEQQQRASRHRARPVSACSAACASPERAASGAWRERFAGGSACLASAASSRPTTTAAEARKVQEVVRTWRAETKARRREWTARENRRRPPRPPAPAASVLGPVPRWFVASRAPP